MSKPPYEKAEFWFGLFTPALVIAIIAPTALLRAWVTSALWGWYIVPAFGVAPLRMVFAFGLSLVANTIVTHQGGCKDERTLTEKYTGVIAVPLAALLLGWVGTFFI